MTVLYYFMSYLAETLTLLMFNENVFDRKGRPEYSPYRTALCYLIQFLISFGISFFEIPKLNLAVFVITTAAVILIGYKGKIRKALYITVMLTVFMFFTELVVIFFTTAVFNTEMYAWEDNAFIFVAQASISKLLYLLIVFLVMKLFFTEKYSDETDKYLIFLGILPVASLFILMFLITFAENHYINEPYDIGLTVGTLLLLVANVTVFYIYTLIQKTNTHVTRLTLEKQKEKSTREYYEMLVSKQENYSILVHDIKRHLQLIDFYAKDGKCEDVVNYVDSIREYFGLDGKIRYSGNQFVDVIVGRYRDICKEKGIDFTAEAVCPDVKFVNGAELTSVLDNMFENAVEGAVKSEMPFVRFSVLTENGNFLVITVENSCDTPPKFKDGIPLSTKKGKNHGIGIKSMRRAADRLEGELNFDFDETNRIFICKFVFKCEF